jgi:hypothetical protein
VAKPPDQQMKEALRASQGTLLRDQCLQGFPHVVRTFFGIMFPAIIGVHMEEAQMEVFDSYFFAYGGYKTYQILAEWLQTIDLEELVSNLVVIVAELLLEQPLPPPPASVQPPPPPPPPANRDSSSRLSSSSCPIDAVVSSVNTTE